MVRRGMRGTAVAALIVLGAAGPALAATSPSPATTTSGSPSTPGSASPSTQGPRAGQRVDTSGTVPVPVLGQALVSAFGAAQERFPTMVVTVHGLRRIDRATVLYYSVGFTGEAPDPEVMPVTHYGTGQGTYDTLQSSPGASFTDSAAAIDVPSGRSYGALRTSSAHAVAAPAPIQPEDRDRLSSRAVVQWIALAPLPRSVKVVDVLVGSAFVKAVPVGDGPLEPTVDSPDPSAGTGWPRIDSQTLAEGSADGAVLPVASQVANRPPTGPKAAPTATPGRAASPTRAR